MTMSFTPLKIPAFYCPIETSVAPDAEQIEQATLAWSARFGVCPDETQRAYLAKTNIGLSASLTIPYGVTRKRQIYSDLTLWLYAFDDSVSDESTSGLDPEVSFLLLRLARMLENPATEFPGNQPWQINAMRNLLRRLENQASDTQVQRCAESLRGFLLNIVLSISGREQHEIPALNDFVMTRLGQGAVQVVTKMIPIVGGYHLSDTELLDPRVRALEEMVNFLTSWDNDIFGYNKETFRSIRYGYPAPASLFSVLAKEYDVTLEEALRIAIGYRDRVMCLFLRLRTEVLRQASPALALYLAGLGKWIRGYLEWAFSSYRFSDPRNPGDDVEIERFEMPTGWAEEPIDDSREPLPVPAISWWWDPQPER